MDRDFNLAAHERFLTSGLILARKWGSREFEQRILIEFGKHKLPVPEVRVSVTYEPSAAAGVADFDNMFSFAPVRWS
jgi:hypothetical protein